MTRTTNGRRIKQRCRSWLNRIKKPGLALGLFLAVGSGIDGESGCAAGVFDGHLCTITGTVEAAKLARLPRHVIDGSRKTWEMNDSRCKFDWEVSSIVSLAAASHAIEYSMKWWQLGATDTHECQRSGPLWPMIVNSEERD